MIDNQHFMGLEHVWFIGIVENRQDPLKTGRVQVRKYGWDSPSKSLQPTNQLIWASVEIPLNSNNVSPPREGTQVRGYFLDGQAAQHPIICAIIPSIPETLGDPTHGFNDPRSNDELKNAPRPPQSVTLKTDGTGVQIQEAPNANRYPTILNEPTTSRIARNENIQDTIIQQKRNNVLQNVPVATGAIPVPGVNLEAFIALPGLAIPPIAANFNLNAGFEFCGLGIGLNLSAGVSFGGLPLTPPIILSTGNIMIGGLDIGSFLSGAIAIGELLALAIDLAGCILGGLKVGNSLMIDGGISLPLLSPGQALNFASIGVRGTIFGGMQLGTIGGIPIAAPPMWNEPQVPYNANYPYNHVITDSESGHVIEVDDTPGAERIHTYHRSGTFDEMGPGGDRVMKTANNQFNIIHADYNTNVMGNQHSTINNEQTNNVQGSQQENVGGTRTLLVSGDDTQTYTGNQQITISKDAHITILQANYRDVKGNEQDVVEGTRYIVTIGDCNIVVQGKLTIASQGDIQIGTKGNMTLTAGASFTINAKDYILNATNSSNENITGNYFMTAQNLAYSLQGSYTGTIGGTFKTTAAHTNMTPLPNN